MTAEFVLFLGAVGLICGGLSLIGLAEGAWAALMDRRERRRRARPIPAGGEFPAPADPRRTGVWHG